METIVKNAQMLVYSPGTIRFLEKNIRMIRMNKLGIRDGGKFNPITTGDEGFPGFPW